MVPTISMVVGATGTRISKARDCVSGCVQAAGSSTTLLSMPSFKPQLFRCFCAQSELKNYDRRHAVLQAENAQLQREVRARKCQVS